jgi:hypothetical protein
VKRFMKVGNAGALLSAVLMCVSGGAPIGRAGEVSSGPAPPQQQASAPARRSMDVVTNAAGELRGAVVNADRAPSANAKVVLGMVGSKESQESTTDTNGRFLFKDVRPGVYSLSVNAEKGQAQSVARVWTQETAPPAASPEAVIPLEDGYTDVVYGGSNGFLGGLGGRGLLCSALVAAGVSSAIAIPVSVSNRNRNRTP